MGAFLSPPLRLAPVTHSTAPRMRAPVVCNPQPPQSGGESQQRRGRVRPDDCLAMRWQHKTAFQHHRAGRPQHARPGGAGGQGIEAVTCASFTQRSPMQGLSAHLPGVGEEGSGLVFPRLSVAAGGRIAGSHDSSRCTSHAHTHTWKLNGDGRCTTREIRLVGRRQVDSGQISVAGGR